MDRIAEFIMSIWEVVAGLLIGGFAHFGLRLDKSEPISTKQIFAYMLQLSFIGLISLVIVLIAQIETPEIRILVAAILAATGRDVVEYMRGKWRPIVEMVFNIKQGGD